jgi:hypothetical protein
MKLKPTYFLPILTICGLLLCGGFWIGDSWWEKLVNAAGTGVQPVQAAANLGEQTKIAYRIQVRDADQLPLERAFVSLQSYPEYQWFTNQLGEVTLRVEPTSQHVTIVANGFITQTFALPMVDGRDEVIVSYQLKPNPLLAQSSR